MAQGVGTGELPLMKFLPSKGNKYLLFVSAFMQHYFFSSDICIWGGELY